MLCLPQAAGLTWNTNMFQPNPPFIRQPPPSFPDRPFFDVPGGDDTGMHNLFGLYAVPDQPDAAIPLPTPGPEVEEDDDEDISESGDIRDFFPETWIWKIFRTK